MQSPFDILAENYDVDFTSTATGRMQRNEVWKYIDSMTYTDPKPALLEINCGTGEDAIHFSEKGFNVTATDISAKMVRIAAEKAKNHKMQIRTLQCDMLDIISEFSPGEFDFVFSNFGGLNCISPEKLKPFSSGVRELLKSGGHFIGVIMSRFCIWDSLFFLLKLRLKESSRRWTKKATVITFNETSFPIWYYSPAQFARFFDSGFKIVKVKPIGLFIPPSYLNGFFSKHRRILSMLGLLERKTENLSYTASFADHFMIDLIKVE